MTHTNKYTITRNIEIDSAHRVMTHGSKCSSIHGHRYKIEATVEAQSLHTEGEQSDMIIDFGFLKDEMVNEIYNDCDHGFIVCFTDTTVMNMFTDQLAAATVLNSIKETLRSDGYFTIRIFDTKLYLVDFIPTAEKLAEHWFNRLKPRVLERSKGIGKLTNLRVWETPNCHADYSE